MHLDGIAVPRDFKFNLWYVLPNIFMCIWRNLVNQILGSCFSFLREWCYKVFFYKLTKCTTKTNFFAHDRFDEQLEKFILFYGFRSSNLTADLLPIADNKIVQDSKISDQLPCGLTFLILNLNGILIRTIWTLSILKFFL